MSESTLFKMPHCWKSHAVTHLYLFLVECPAGQYWLESAKSCVDCPRDSYQDESAQSECKSCPDNTYSDDEGAVCSTTCKCKYRNIITFALCSSHLLMF